jgi:hypothetical protein
MSPAELGPEKLRWRGPAATATHIPVLSSERTSYINKDATVQKSFQGKRKEKIGDWSLMVDRLCGLVVRVLSYRSGGPGSIIGTTKKKVVGLERGPLSLLSTTEELFDRKVAAPV